METEKRRYSTPTVRVVKMRQRARLLAGSEVKARMNSNFEEEDW